MPALLILVPAALVLKQPDLGTALMLVLGGGAMFFLAGVRLVACSARRAAAGGGARAARLAHPARLSEERASTPSSIPRTIRSARAITACNPRSRIGSGGIFGKGFLLGTQSHLTSCPRSQTDFIFTMLAEEFGLVGGLALLALYALVLAYGFAIAFRSRNHFGRLLALGIATNFFLYVFINMAMVMGLIPVVGVPLPLISYGGTAMLTVMFGFGLLMSVYIHRDVRIGRFGESQVV